MSSNISFTIRRPTPVSRATSSGPDSDTGSSFKVPKIPSHLIDEPPRLGSPLARSQSSVTSRYPAPENDRIDSSDEGSSNEDELVTGFDKFGVQRLNGEKKTIDKPLVIPALKNKDWRELARKRRAATSYVPPSAAAETGKDGSVGGLGTRDTINSGPVLSGLQVKRKTSTIVNADTVDTVETEEVKMDVVAEESEDQKALRAILAESAGEIQHEGPTIDIIPQQISEADALKQDVEELPDAATLEDYARVPISQFGAALLRGMGWKEGTAATKKPGKGLIEPYIPAPRPALLGIGAKEQEVYDDGSKKNRSSNKRQDCRYVPVIKQERADAPSPTGGSRPRTDRSRSPRRSGPSSRRSSPDRYNSRSERDIKNRYDESRDNDGKSGRNEFKDRRRDEGRERDRRDDNRERDRRDDSREQDLGRRRDRERDRPDDDRSSKRRDGDRDMSERKRKRERSDDSSRRKRDY